MSVQLIVYPQNYEGFSNSNNPSTQFLIDGINFTSVNASNNFFVAQPNGVQEAINFYNPTLPVNTWKRYSQGTSNVSVATNTLTISILAASPQQGIIQKLSNLTVGGVYDITIDYSLLINGNNVLNLSTFTGSILQSSQPFPVNVSTNTIISFQFTANSTEDTIVIGGNSSTNGLINISNISIVAAPTQPSGAIQLLGDGQVILDLYEDEDLPLSLSVDDFKNVAEQVQSYSKAFNVPATKRNNRIFDHIFEVTREVESAGSLLFNPYKKTKCVLKQDGFILFEGYLRMLDITDKEGEISYNLNLYSEVIALADLLQERTFNDLGFEELAHNYNKDNIKRSWNDLGNSIAYTNPSTSGFRDAYTSLRYPFVDWNRQWIVANNPNASGPTNGNPQLTSLEQAFRPFINVKYIIDRIFEATDFTYDSVFFNTSDFKKLYMDFNWGTDNSPVNIDTTLTAVTDVTTTATSSYVTMPQDNNNFNSDFGYSGGVYTAQFDNQIYDINYNFTTRLTNAAAGATTFIGEARWKLVKSGITTFPVSTTYNQTAGALTINEILWTGSLLETLNIGDTLTPEFYNDTSVGTAVWDTLPTNFAGQPIETIVNISSPIITTNILLQTLRGELGQWEFLKGLITMFNLVSLPDENNPNNIKIEPYADVFINSADSVQLNWTEKIDVSEMKLTPLADLNRKTIFKFVEDEDDFAFNNYKNQVGGHLYGSQMSNATDQFNLLDGEDEIVAEPFAATLVKPLEDIFPQFITPAIYSYNPQDDTSEGFENSPRIMFNNGVKNTGVSYYIPEQNGLSSENQQLFLQFSHLSDIATITTNPPAITDTRDFHFGDCQLLPGVGDPSANNLYNLYWSDYFNQLYNPNTRTMTIKVNLTPADINTFKFNDTVYIKNRIFRVNKIDYKPNDLATVEFILIT